MNSKFVRDESIVVRLDQNDEISCFCYASDVEKNLCVCALKGEVIPATITMEIVSSPKEKVSAVPVNDANDPKLNRAVRSLKRSNSAIKRSLVDLEKSISRLRFRP